MKQIVILIRPFRAEELLSSLEKLGGVVSEAKGYGRQKSYLDSYQGSEFSTAFVPKVEIKVWVEDELVEEVLQLATRVARTGRIGDGKAFVLPLVPERVISF